MYCNLASFYNLIRYFHKRSMIFTALWCSFVSPISCLNMFAFCVVKGNTETEPQINQLYEIEKEWRNDEPS